MRRVSASERRRRLLQLDQPTPTGVGATHRKAVMAGAPSKTADPRRLSPKLRQAGQAATHKHIFAEAKRVGAPVVQFNHPGNVGHERCGDICVEYLTRAEADARLAAQERAFRPAPARKRRRSPR